MPRTQESTPSKFRKYVEEFGHHVLTTDGQVLRCQVCECELKAYQKSQVTQHVVGKKHVERIKKLGEQSCVGEMCMTSSEPPCSSSSTQSFVTPDCLEEEVIRAKRAKYQSDLCSAFVHADIPFWKINNPALRSFLEMYTNFKTPDEATIRKNYLFAEFESTIGKIRKELDGKFVYVQIDELIDRTGRIVASVVVGPLTPDGPGLPRLLNVVLLEKADQITVEQLFEQSMLILWPNGPRREMVALFVSDSTPYMKAAACNLRENAYPNLIHTTCLAHDLHRACKEIREQLHEVDMLVVHGRKVFLKALNRIRRFIDVTPEISLPPEPIATRWATWINAANYYADNYATLCEIFGQLDDDSQSVKKVKLLMTSSKLKDDLAFIRCNYSYLYEAIARLETPGLMLNDALAIVAGVQAQIASVSGGIGRAIADKLYTVLASNKGYTTMQAIGRILANEATEDDRNFEEIRNLSPLQVASYKFAPITLFDSDRSFNRYKTVLQESRERFALENLQIFLIVHSNVF